MSSTFRIVFSGEILPGHDTETVKRAVADLLKAPPDQLALLFSGQPIVLRKGLQEADAPRFVERLTLTGIRVHLQAEDQAAAPVAPQPQAMPQPTPSAQLSVEPTVIVAPPPRAPAPQSIPPSNPPHWDQTTMLVTPDAVMAGAAAVMPGQAQAQHRPPPQAQPQSEATVIVTPQRPAPSHADATIIVAPQRPQAAAHSDATVIVSRAEIDARGLGGVTKAPANEDDALTPAQLWAKAAAAAAAASTEVPLFGLSFEGRLGRLSYFAAMLIIGAALTLAAGICFRIAHALPSPANYIMIALAVIFFVAALPLQFRLIALRLHDIDQSGWLSLLSAVPFVGWIVPLGLLFVPGTPTNNTYGLQAKSVSTRFAMGAGGAMVASWILTTVIFLF